MTNEQKTLKFKIFAMAYYPLQYFIIRFLTVGTDIQPTLLQLYNGFNITGIMSVVVDFLSHIQGTFTAEYYVFIILNILPYLVRLLWELIPVIAFIFGAYQLIVFIVAQISILKHNSSINMQDVITIRIGQPGCGKSSSGIYDAIIIAAAMWQELKFKYWLMKFQVADYIKNGQTQKILEWYEVRDSYEYYITHDCIPCLYSNIPICKDGQYSSVFTRDHGEQKLRIPYYTYCYVDEYGSIFKVEESLNKNYAVSDLHRLPRHFGFIFGGTEQDPENIYIDVRRSVAKNIYMLKQEWVNKPLLLLCIYKPFKKLFSNIEKGSKNLSSFMMWLNTVIKHIGQRKYKYIVQQNVELQAVGITQKIGTYYLPTMLNCQYDERTFKNLYLAKDKEIAVDIFDCLTVANTEKNKKKFLKTAVKAAV